MHIGVLLREMFSGGPSISLTVKEDQIWRLITQLFSKTKEICPLKNSALMDALNELLIVSYTDSSHFGI